MFTLKITKGITKIGLVVVAFPLLRAVTSIENIPGGLTFMTLLSLAVIIFAVYLAYQVIKPSQ